MHPCQRNWVTIGRLVMYNAQTAHAFSAGIKWQHCNFTAIYTVFIHFSTDSNAELREAGMSIYSLYF